MPWSAYWGIARRRWLLILAIIALDVVASAYLYARSTRNAGFQACLTLYIADVSAPSLINAPSSTLDTAGQLLAGETAANFFADDIKDVAGSGIVATYISNHLQSQHLPNTGYGDINGAISGSRLDRTVNLCDSNPQSNSARAVATVLGQAMTSQRQKFIGPQMAKRTFVRVISQPSVGAVSSHHQLLNAALRIVLGIVVALGLALLWDALDPTVRNSTDVERVLDVPVLSGSR